MPQKLNELALGYAGAIVSAGVMLIMSLLATIGFYTNAAQQMMKWHIFYSLGAVGIIGGMIEASLISFILLYAFGWTYNKFT